jgi:hypothetical protein
MRRFFKKACLQTSTKMMYNIEYTICSQGLIQYNCRAAQLAAVALFECRQVQY